MSTVVIGGGIVGNSLTGWLAELGVTDLVQLDKGPFPNPGGSTGHASNFIFPVDHSKEMTQLTLESMRQYRETGTLHECGGVEVARTEERMEELRRRMASAKSWGVEDCRLVTPQVVGFKLHGKLPEGSTATDLVLTITQILRSHGVDLGPPPPEDQLLIAAIKLAAVDAGRSFALAPENWPHPIPDSVTWSPLAGHPLVRRTWVVWPANSRRRDLGQLVTAFEVPP